MQARQTKAKDMSQEERCRLPCWRAKPRGVRAPTETTCSVSDVTLCTHLHSKSETVSHKPTGMTRDCRSLPRTHPRSTHPDRHTPLHVKTLDFTWFTATCTRLSSRSPHVRTACEETRGDLCTAGEETVRVEACRFRPSSLPVNHCQKLLCVLKLSTPAAILDHSFLIAFDIFSRSAPQSSRLGSSFAVPHRHRLCIHQTASTADAERLAAGFVLRARVCASESMCAMACGTTCVRSFGRVPCRVFGMESSCGAVAMYLASVSPHMFCKPLPAPVDRVSSTRPCVVWEQLRQVAAERPVTPSTSDVTVQWCSSLRTVMV